MHTNQDGTAQHSRPATTERAIQHNGQSFVGNDVAEQQCDKDPMLALLQQAQDFGSTLLLASLARGSDNLQVDFILAHEGNCQTSKDSTQEHKGNGNAQIDP